MRIFGAVLFTVTLSAHAAILAKGQWRVTVHSPYLNTTYTACNRGAATVAWMLRQSGQHCRTVFWHQTGPVINAQEVCRQAMPNGGAASTHTDIHLTLGPRDRSYAGQIEAHVHTPMGVFSSQEAVSAHWLSGSCPSH